MLKFKNVEGEVIFEIKDEDTKPRKLKHKKKKKVQDKGQQEEK